jgi:predicted RNA binding protein YcfA (HicA-like mRNA interferase family)
MTFREIEKIIIQDGWYLSSTRGSHHHYRHPTKPGKVTIPKHSGNIHIRVINSIKKQAQL